MLLSTGRFFGAASGAGTAAWKVPVTIPSGKVASDLSNFPVFVDLSGMPAGFWTHLVDGGDLRIKTAGGTDIPFDLIVVNTAQQTGRLFFKAASLLAASSNVWYIHYGDSTLDLLPVSDTNGRNAVWSDYHRVVVFDELVDRTGNGSDAVISGTAANWDFVDTSASPEFGLHTQGVAWDGTYYYVVFTNEIRKYNSSWVLQATNSDPIAASGLSANHCGDPEVHSGLLYVPIETYTNSPYNNQHIAVFNASDLSFSTSYDISAQGHEASSIGYNPADGYLYITSFVSAGAPLYKYDLTGNYIGTLALTGASPASKQGVTFYNSKIYISSDSSAKRVYRYSLAGAFEELAYGIATSGANALEGLSVNSTGLLQVIGTSSGGKVHVLTEGIPGIPGWLNLDGSGHAAFTGLTKFTQWSMGASASMDAKGANRSVLSYTQAGSTATGNRATLVFRSSSDLWGLWNSSDTWLTGGSSPTLNQHYRLNGTHDGVANRKLYIDGSGVTDATVAQRPAGTGDGLYIGSGDSGGTERFHGSINYVYLRNGILSADWIAAERASWETPASFYTIGAETLA